MYNEKIKIADYKNHIIFYDEDDDKFSTTFELKDDVKTKKRSSLKDIKKDIDTYLKDNKNFKPFKLIKKQKYSNNFEIVNVIGLRTDNKYIIEGKYSNSYISVDKLSDDDAYDQYYEYDDSIYNDNLLIDEEYDKLYKTVSKKRETIVKRLKPFKSE